MTTPVLVPSVDELEQLWDLGNDDDNELHYVCTAHQPSPRPTYVTLCGKVLTADQAITEPWSGPVCPICDVKTVCRVCGAHLERK